jgi:outer membrane protein OmpA-like peptidoglycan-associated protein
MLRLVFLYILLSCTGLCHAQNGDTTRLYFDLDVDSLSNTSKQKLSVFLRNIDRNKNVVIIGYTDYLGTEDYNIVLSKERARNVAYYLLEHEVSDQNITVCMGRGRVERKGIARSSGFPTDRRVDIVLVDKARKPVTKDTAKRKPTLRKDPMDVSVVVKPGGNNPVPDDMKNIPLYRAAPKSTPKPPGTSYKINDSGNIYVVMRPGGEKTAVPPQIKNAGPGSDSKDPYKNKNELDLTNINAGETFVLKNIYFHPQSHTVRDESMPEMEKLANALKKYPTLKIQVEGHICCVVDFPDAFDVDEQNNHLSVNRAKYIYDYLITKGIARDRLKFAGFGRSQPVVEIEKTEEEANKNRRVEVRILAK